MKLRTWPVVAGILVDTVGTLFVGFLYLAAILAVSIVRGESETTFSTAQMVGVEIVGLLLTAVGGFVAAQMARIYQLQHGIAVGVGALIVWAVVELAGLGVGTLPLWYTVSSLAASVPMGAAGGYLAGLRRTRDTRPGASGS